MANFISNYRASRKMVVARNADPERRAAIEQSAVRATRRHYEQAGFTVRDVQRDNLGWDLEARRRREQLLLEVKGLSGPNVVVELTPNEYAQMQRQRARYRLCVVSQALNLREATLHRFAHDATRSQWLDQNDNVLDVDERVGARAQASRAR